MQSNNIPIQASLDSFTGLLESTGEELERFGSSLANVPWMVNTQTGQLVATEQRVQMSAVELSVQMASMGYSGKMDPMEQMEAMGQMHAMGQMQAMGQMEAMGQISDQAASAMPELTELNDQTSSTGLSGQMPTTSQSVQPVLILLTTPNANPIALDADIRGATIPTVNINEIVSFSYCFLVGLNDNYTVRFCYF